MRTLRVMACAYCPFWRYEPADERLASIWEERCIARSDRGRLIYDTDCSRERDRKCPLPLSVRVEGR